ncbi:tyrosine-type recombinase/integrase [Rickettsia endosymbiont of Oedothorax gibbosus]|uniref:tyrosine-type recombinase/integrase n=1 Tax=Rickettsia endosymbiont of Oedothorax gibbosus TaxID=931099 RepID=UPI0020243AFE|nr:site-specific integrase [Rickettsia endosymbiont of Oedothorax gibbosus]
MTINSFNFTKVIIEKITPPPAEKSSKGNVIRPKIVQHVYRDTEEKGLVLNVSYLGAKSFFLNKTINGTRHKIKLGSFPHKLESSPDDISITAARAKAAEFKNQLAKGINPTLAKTQELKKEKQEEQEMTFKEFFDNKYIENYAKHKIKRWKHVVADINRQAEHLYTRKLSTIQRDDVQKIFNDLTKDGKKIMANKCVQRFIGIFNRAVEWGILANNPITGITKHPEKSRDRYLLAEEKERFLEVVKEEPQIIQDVILMHLYTAARKGDILSMQWDNINLIDETWYVPNPKKGVPYLVPLTKQAMEILKARYEQRDPQCPWVFPSDHDSKSGHLEDPKRAWIKIRKKAGLKDFKLHDLRRTMGSWMAIAGASQYVIGKALNHKNPRSTSIYARLSIDPVREFMEKADNIFDKNNNKKA